MWYVMMLLGIYILTATLIHSHQSWVTVDRIPWEETETDDG